MKKLIFLAVLFIPCFARGSEIINPNAKYQIIVVRYDKETAWPEGLSKVSAEGWRTMNETNGIIKIDVTTGASWILVIDSKREHFWVPIAHGEIKK